MHCHLCHSTLPKHMVCTLKDRKVGKWKCYVRWGRNYARAHHHQRCRWMTMEKLKYWAPLSMRIKYSLLSLLMSSKLQHFTTRSKHTGTHMLPFTVHKQHSIRKTQWTTQWGPLKVYELTQAIGYLSVQATNHNITSSNCVIVSKNTYSMNHSITIKLRTKHNVSTIC